MRLVSPGVWPIVGFSRQRLNERVAFWFGSVWLPGYSFRQAIIARASHFERVAAGFMLRSGPVDQLRRLALCDSFGFSDLLLIFACIGTGWRQLHFGFRVSIGFWHL
jgi:hypothetical protein